MAFLLALRAKGIADVSVLRALEMAPRENFVPRRHVDLALRDIALPIPCGQTMPEPFLVARMMEALDLKPAHRVLEIGAGSGYATAILAQLAGQVISFERFRSLAVEAQMRLQALGLNNAHVEWDDGLDALASIRLEGADLFDRILVHGVVDGQPTALMEALSEGGIIVMARHLEGRGRRLVRIVHRDGGFEESELHRCRLGPLLAGRSAGL
ncbi:MAG: Protein-L-isoaspartate(D-aspartate) O-methyltransferase [Hyphomicrobiales bacterium]|nr:Protein-L-isoaspartate(D-aspartate) O-methyltransferase [Hyphomicrobiales bacterium]